MAALVSGKQKSMQVALAHLFFNITGILIFYPVPFMRKFPLNAAKKLGRATRIWRGFPIVYIAICFFAIPLLLLGISTMFEQDSKGLTVLGSIIVVFLALGIGYFVYWYNYKEGNESCNMCFQERERRRVVMKELPDDMEYLKAKMDALIAHTGLPEDEIEDAAKVETGAEEEEEA